MQVTHLFYVKGLNMAHLDIHHHMYNDMKCAFASVVFILYALITFTIQTLNKSVCLHLLLTTRILCH